MRYCIADIHGHYTEFMRLLERIKFNSNDELYILGDLCDRGTENLEVLEYVMNNRDNVFCIKGNHDEYIEYWFSQSLDCYKHWSSRSVGKTTFEQLKNLSREKKLEILQFLKEMPYYRILGNTVLVHGGIFTRAIDVSKYSVDNIELLMQQIPTDDMVWARPNEPWLGYNQAPEGVKFIVGHTPTTYLKGIDRVLVGSNTTFIDCGGAYGYNLACLCLDTDEIWYEKCSI